MVPLPPSPLAPVASARPTYLHQIWFDIGDGPAPPAYATQRMQRMRMLNPHMTYKLWTLDEAEVMVGGVRALCDIWERLPHGINRVDFFRYVLMHKFGGFYFDLDFVCVRALDGIGLEAGCVLLCEEWPFSFVGGSVHNGAIASGDAGHPFWPLVFGLIRSRLDRPIATGDIQQAVFRLTGTALLRDAAMLYWKNGSAADGSRVQAMFPLVVAPFGLFCPVVSVASGKLVDTYHEESNDASSAVSDRPTRWCLPDTDRRVSALTYALLAPSTKLWQKGFA